MAWGVRYYQAKAAARTMLHGVHRPGVDVEVWVDLDRCDAETERLEQQARAARDDPLADAGDDTARHQNVPHHFHVAMYQTRKTTGPPESRLPHALNPLSPLKHSVFRINFVFLSLSLSLCPFLFSSALSLSLCLSLPLSVSLASSLANAARAARARTCSRNDHAAPSRQKLFF